MEYTKLKLINEYMSESINPANTPDTVFEMYSVPIYNTGHPEFLRGDEIGSSKVVVQKNDILLCKINPRINRVWVVADESEHLNIASSEWIVIRNRKYNPSFLAWYFRSPRFKQLMVSEVTGIGGSLTRAQPKAVAEYPVPVLPRAEQDKIVKVLDKATSNITARQQQLSTLDDLIKARFVEMFGNPDLGQPRSNWKTISSIGVVVGGATPKTNIAEYWDGEHRWITPAELGNASGYIFDSARKLTDAGVKSCSLTEMPVGTVILSSRAPIGKVAIAGNTFYCNQGFKNIICSREMHPVFLYTLLRLNTDYLNSLGRGATFKEISKSIVENIRIPVPAIEQQEQFAAFVAQIDKSKSVIQKSLDETQLLFDSLMQEYFG
jgi:type I restriction enzyme S subunit